MKKTLLILTAFLTMCMTAIAQERKAGYEKKGFLILSAGPSFPLGDFKSKGREDYISTFTRTGFNLDLQGGYHFVKYFGVTGSVFYNFYSYNEQRLKEDLGIPANENVTIDHWKLYGIVVGPMVTGVITPKTFVDFNVMTGIISANSPKVSVGSNSSSEVVITEDWATAIPLRVSGGMRFQFGRDGYLAIGLNYFYAEPEFKTTFYNQDLVKHQPISALSLNAGVGFKF